MGWNLTLTSDKEITFEEVSKIIENLPEHLSFFGYKPNLNEWGWSVATDISKPNGKELSISGSYGISGEKARPMMKYLKSQLENNGHKIIVSGDIGVGEIISDDNKSNNEIEDTNDCIQLLRPNELRELDRKTLELSRRERIKDMTLEEKVDFLLELWVRDEL